jgi:hypothetical protein
MVKIKKFRTDILINDDKPPEDDLQFIRSNGFKPTNILRMKIKELKAQAQGINPTEESLKAQIIRLAALNEKLFEYLDKKGLSNDFYNGK